MSAATSGGHARRGREGKATRPEPAPPCLPPPASRRPGPEGKPAMTGDQPPPGTCGQPPNPDELPFGREVITVAGPWTVQSCVTAACTGCGVLPLDEDTSMTPHFASTSQAAEELTQNWGWTHKQRSGWPKDDQLLCPGCAAPRGGVRTALHAEGAGPWLG